MSNTFMNDDDGYYNQNEDGKKTREGYRAHIAAMPVLEALPG